MGKDADVQLSDMERERLEDMLRGLSVERAAVRAAMLFALEHAACAAEICDVLSASLTLAETPPHLKVARCAPAPCMLSTRGAQQRAVSRQRTPRACALSLAALISTRLPYPCEFCCEESPLLDACTVSNPVQALPRL